MDFTLLLKEKYSSLSSAQKQIADYISEYPEDVLKQSALEIGQKSGTSAATVIRFGKALGFGSLEELKITIAQNKNVLSDSDGINPIFSPSDTSSILAQKVLNLTTTALQITNKQLDVDALDAAIDTLLNANIVYLYGIGASALVASDLQQKLNRTGKIAMYSSDTHIGLEYSYYMKPTDAMIALTYSGKTKEVLLALEQAKKNGIPSILITRSENPAILELADIVLRVPNTEEFLRIGAISSKYSSMFIADLLFLGYVQQLYDEEFETHFIATSKIVSALKTK